MDKPSKKLKISSSTKLISHYVKNIEFNATSKKPVSHYVKNDEPINHCSKPISHYIKTGQLKISPSALNSNYSQPNELKTTAENTDPEPNWAENRRVRSRRNYISQIMNSGEPTDARPGRNISQILNENFKENESYHQIVPINENQCESGRKVNRTKSVLISDYIKNTEVRADSSIYLGKSQLISKLIGLDANICSSPSSLVSEPKDNEPELNQSLVNYSKKKTRENFISHYLQTKSSDDSILSQKSELDITSVEKSLVKLRRSKLISQYIKNENIDWNSAQFVEKMQDARPKSKQAGRSKYISSFIKHCDDVSLLTDCQNTLNKIIRRNMALSNGKIVRRVFRRNKSQKDKFLKKYIKLDNIVNRLRKTKKFD